MSPEKKSIKWQTHNVDLPEGSVKDLSTVSEKSSLQFDLRSLGRIEKSVSLYENPETTKYYGQKKSRSEQQEISGYPGRFNFELPRKRSNSSDNLELYQLGSFSFGLPGKRSLLSEQDQLDKLGRFSFGLPGKRSSKSEQDELDKLGRFSFGMPGKRSIQSEQDHLDQFGRFSFGIPGKSSSEIKENELEKFGRFSFGIPGKRTSELQNQSKNSGARDLESKKKYLENMDFELAKRKFPNEVENNINIPIGSKFGQPKSNQKSCENLMTKIAFLLKEAQFYSKRPWLKEIGRVGKRDPNLVYKVTGDTTNISNPLELKQESRTKKPKNSRVQPFFR